MLHFVEEDDILAEISRYWVTRNFKDLHYSLKEYLKDPFAW